MFQRVKPGLSGTSETQGIPGLSGSLQVRRDVVFLQEPDRVRMGAPSLETHPKVSQGHKAVTRCYQLPGLRKRKASESSFPCKLRNLVIEAVIAPHQAIGSSGSVDSKNTQPTAHKGRKSDHSDKNQQNLGNKGFNSISKSRENCGRITWHHRMALSKVPALKALSKTFWG